MVSSVGMALDGGRGAAWAEIADRAIAPAQVAMMVRTISHSLFIRAMIAKIVLDVELGLGDAAISLNLKFPASWGSYVAGRSNMSTHRMRPPLARIKIAACLAITFAGVNSANAEVVIKPEDLIGTWEMVAEKNPKTEPSLWMQAQQIGGRGSRGRIGPWSECGAIAAW